jgi:membrane protein implicated in regulation of membrane protease activity
MMRATHRRALGIAATGVFLTVYIFIAGAIGGLFATKPVWAQITFFAVAGLIWVLPLYPLFKWMRVPDDHELPPEAPPDVSKVRRGGR